MPLSHLLVFFVPNEVLIRLVIYKFVYWLRVFTIVFLLLKSCVVASRRSYYVPSDLLRWFKISYPKAPNA